jgi:hypothetical protein
MACERPFPVVTDSPNTDHDLGRSSSVAGRRIAAFTIAHVSADLLDRGVALLGG